MNEQDALLETIFDRPADDAPRLIYSDWLEEHDLPGYAAFIRVQVRHSRQVLDALHGKALTHIAFPAPVKDDHPAWHQYRAEIAPAAAWAELVKFSAFVRGFPWEPLNVTVAALRDHSRDWWPLFPVTALICPLSPLTVAEFVRVPYLARLRELILEGQDPHGLVIPRLAQCHYLKDLRILDLATFPVGIEAVEVLAKAEIFSRLLELRLPSTMRPNGGAAKLLREKFGDICVF